MMRTRSLPRRTSLLLPLALAAAGLEASAQLGAGGPTLDLKAPSFVGAPTFTPGPNPRAPLVATIQVQTDEPTQVLLAFKDGERSWVTLVEPEYGTEHEVLALGVRPDRTHYVTVIARDAAGNQVMSREPFVWTTPPLPPLFPELHTTVSQPQLMEPGVTLLNASNNRFHPSYLIAVDHEGEVIWYLESDEQIGDARRLRNGNFLYNHNRFQVNELDLRGEVVGVWFAGRLWPDRAPDGAVLVDADSFHHEVGEMPSFEVADFVAVSSELRLYPDYPADETDQTITKPVAQVIGDVIVEFTRAGTVVHETRLLDALDPYRVCYDSLAGFWDLQYASGETDDWSHANAVVYDPYEEAYIVSARSQEAIVKLRRDTGELLWILGPHDNWDAPWQPYLLRPVGAPFEWQYHQHAPEPGPDGALLLFDNGNGRAVPPAPLLPWAQRYSRAVEYRIDPVAMTVEQRWSYGSLAPSEHFYSGTRGDADRMPTTRNVLVTDSDRRDTDASATAWARVFELTTSGAPQVVFELQVRDLSAQPRSWNVYRAERIRGLYPHE